MIKIVRGSTDDRVGHPHAGPAERSRRGSSAGADSTACSIPERGFGSNPDAPVASDRIVRLRIRASPEDAGPDDQRERPLSSPEARAVRVLRRIDRLEEQGQFDSERIVVEVVTQPHDRLHRRVYAALSPARRAIYRASEAGTLVEARLCRLVEVPDGPMVTTAARDD